MSAEPTAGAYKDAFDRDEFHLLFQPQVSLSTGQIIGSEALLRWDSSEFASVSPTQIISLAKERNHMIELGKWVLNEALRHNQNFHSSGAPSSLSVAVNVSPVQFLGREEQFREDVEDLLQDTGHAANQLELEITEEALIQNLEDTRNTFLALADSGISLAMDDFGTGYSSLSYLTKIPFNTLKIDREFILTINSDQRSTKLVDGIIAMGRSMEKTVLAEGVDSMQQLEHLRSEGCHLYQGYLYSKPLLPEQFLNLVSDPA